jgi:hypothetical protein
MGDPASGGGRGILAIWTDIAPEIEAEFNEWYWREHLPERLSVPGFRSGRRYRALAGTPRYFAWYELDTAETLTSRAYLERLENPTEWTRRVMPGFRNTTRATFRLLRRIGGACGGVMLTLRLDAAEGGSLAALLPALCAAPGILRAQLWESAQLPSPNTRETALRGAADKSAAWAIAVEAATVEQLAAAAPLLRPLSDRGEIATYQFLCGLPA